MQLNFKLCWMRTFKYRFNGTTFFDNVVINSNTLSINTGYLDLKSQNSDIDYEFKIAKAILVEAHCFLEKINL